MKNILIINGNSKADSLCHALAKQYHDAATQAGYASELVHLSALDFDPVLRAGYDYKQALEPDLNNLKEAITRADHLVFVYPVWWGTIPALLKGVFDRLFLPGYAFKYEKGSPFPKGLLKGRSARLLVTMDTPPWYYKLFYGAPAHKMMKRTVLEFCGIKPVKISEFGPVIHSTPKQRKQWLKQAAQLGARGN